jgi:hypothetical protein
MINKILLKKFLDSAIEATYAGGGKEEKIPERSGFKELVYTEGDWNYRDSYTGFYRARGMEVVRFQNIPVWTASYGGGMITGKEDLAKATYTFLKNAMLAKDPTKYSARGPHHFTDGDFEYNYVQEGNIEEFNGYEEIFYQGDLVFFHRIIGGTIIHN